MHLSLWSRKELTFILSIIRLEKKFVAALNEKHGKDEENLLYYRATNLKHSKLNAVLLAKLGRKVTKDPHNLWTKVVSEKYLIKGDFYEVK